MHVRACVPMQVDMRLSGVIKGCPGAVPDVEAAVSRTQQRITMMTQRAGHRRLRQGD